MKNATFVKTALIAASLPLFAGCVERQVVYRDRPVYVQPAPGTPPGQAVVEDPAPPPPQVEVQTVAPDPTFIWIGGGWEWRANGWVWFGGHWAPRPHPGGAWVRGGWAHRGHGRVWVGAHWR